MFAEFLDIERSVSLLTWVMGWLLVFFSLSFNYFVIAGGSYWYYWLNPKSKAIRLHDNAIPKNQIRREIFWSMMSIAVFATLSMMMVVAWRQGLFPLLYFHPLEHGLGIFILGFALFVFIQDVLYYWLHRLLHTRRLIRIHRTHHVSRVTTPFSIYCFHPVEAVIHFVRLPVALMICPVNFFAVLFAEGMISNVLNAYSHLNHEPKWISRIRPIHSRLGAASAYHSLHHLRGHGNYGGYFRIWDKMHGTQLSESAETDAKGYGQ